MKNLMGALLALTVVLWSCENVVNSSTSSASTPRAFALGKIAAAGYSAMKGVQTESCSEGGLDVGWIDAGDWMVYPVSVPAAGNYTVQYRVASINGGRLSADYHAGGNQLGQVAVPATGGWQNWTTITQTVTLPAGNINFGINAVTGGWNLQWLTITQQTGPTSSFTIVAIPDTQFYTASAFGGTPAIMQNQLDWVVANQGPLNIALVTQLGDLTDHGAWDPVEYTYAANIWKTLQNSSLVWDLLPGNHEGYGQGWVYNYSNVQNYNRAFPPSIFDGKPWFGGSFPAGTTNNSYVLFSAGGMDFINVSLGCLGFNGASIDGQSMAWANSVLDKYPNRRAIISTHDDLHEGGYDAPGQTLWDVVVKNHENVFMVLCGHNKREFFQTSRHPSGKPVFELLSDYQGDPNGGNGWLRYYTFVPSQNKIQVFTYSPWLKSFETDANSQFEIAYSMN